ncbi:MAG TPA: hypothetical protein VMU64_03710 [Acidimicrobiales bacterium]|nr:hypothetical protein [Acidimicrobiales bacterium]
MRTVPIPRLHRLLVISVVALGVSWSSGCTAARNTLGTNSSPCFHALALAADAVHDQGVFAGVRLVSDASLAKHGRMEALIRARSSTPLHSLCLVAYRGTFRLSQVLHPAGRMPSSGVGHFAIVVVSTPQNKLLATFVLEKEPVRFRHLALGALAGAGSRGPPSVLG